MLKSNGFNLFKNVLFLSHEISLFPIYVTWHKIEYNILQINSLK